jgi:serine/threonine-protein kinase
MKMPSMIAAAAAAAFALLWAGRASADPSTDDKALATALFEQGRALMTAGRTAEACPKLEESHRLDPSGGTILNLALCNEQQGLLARSWSEYHEAIAFAVRDGRGDRAQVAEAHAHALEPRLSKLTVVVSEGARVDGLRVERDGRELGQASWSTAMPVDGGEHIVRATAPGKAPFSTTLVVGTESDSRTVEVPPFVALVVPPAAAIASVPPPAAVLIAPVSPNTNVARGSATRRRVGWAIGAAGLAQLGAAGYFGVQAFRKHAESNSACPNDNCTMTGVGLENQAGRAADIATVLSVTGFATIATGVYLLWTSR